MTDREKLIDLLNDVGKNVMQFETGNFIESLADHLIANGVTIVEKPKPQKQLCINWNPGHHGMPQRCEQPFSWKYCSCNGDFEKCDWRTK